MPHHTPNATPSEIAQFDRIAAHWWDPEGEFKPLHAMNPVRCAYIDKCVDLAGKRVLDVGCGGGLLAEAMARLGADVTGLDLGAQTIEVAKLHALESKLPIHYRVEPIEDHTIAYAGKYDAITCLEMLEHVPAPEQIINQIATLLKPGGHAVVSTLNRHPKAYALAILGAEYIMKILPKGTHHYSQFIRPSELARWARTAGLEIQDTKGLTLHPLTYRCSLNDDVSINYLMLLHKPLQPLHS